MTLEQAQQEADRLNREQRLKKGKWTAHCYNGEWIVSPVFRTRWTARWYPVPKDWQEFEGRVNGLASSLTICLENARFLPGGPFQSATSAGLIRALALHLAEREWMQEEPVSE